MTKRLPSLLLAPLGALAAHALGYRAVGLIAHDASHTGHAHLPGLTVLAAALALVGVGLLSGRRPAPRARGPATGERRSWQDLVVWQSALLLVLELVEAGFGLNAVPLAAVALALLAQVLTAWWLHRLMRLVSRPAPRPQRSARPPAPGSSGDTRHHRLVGTRVVATPRLLRAPPGRFLSA